MISVIHSILNQNPASFPTGLRIWLDGGLVDGGTQLMEHFPKISVPSCLEIGQLSKVAPILHQHATTLQTLTLSCESGYVTVTFHTMLDLPILPQLITLDFMFSAKSSTKGWTLEMLDCLNFREIILVRRFSDSKMIWFLLKFS